MNRQVGYSFLLCEKFAATAEAAFPLSALSRRENVFFHKLNNGGARAKFSHVTYVATWSRERIINTNDIHTVSRPPSQRHNGSGGRQFTFHPSPQLVAYCNKPTVDAMLFLLASLYLYSIFMQRARTNGKADYCARNVIAPIMQIRTASRQFRRDDLDYFRDPILIAWFAGERQ